MTAIVFLFVVVSLGLMLNMRIVQSARLRVMNGITRRAPTALLSSQPHAHRRRRGEEKRCQMILVDRGDHQPAGGRRVQMRQSPLRGTGSRDRDVELRG